MGAPATRSARVGISFRNRDADQSEDRLVSLGYTNENFGIHNDKGWWLELSVSESVLERLSRAVLNNQIRSLRVGVGLGELYTDAGPGAMDFGERIDLFLRPNIHDGDVSQPEVAQGKLAGWWMKLGSVTELSDPFAPEAPPVPESITAGKPQSPSVSEKTLAAIEKLSAETATLRSTVTKASWGVIIVLILLAMIRCRVNLPCCEFLVNSRI